MHHEVYCISWSYLLSFLYNPYIIPFLIGRAGASSPSRTNSMIFLRVVRTSCPKSSTCFFFSDISIFLHRKCYTRFFFSGISIFRNLCMYAMRHGIVLSAMDSSTFNSSAMDSSAIGVGVDVLVGKCMQGPAARCLIFSVSDSTETFLTVSYCSQISMHLSTSHSLCSALHVNHCAAQYM